jgi:hypothetical protein
LTWDDLNRELDAWATSGKTAEFWWRDDDATAATPALERLLELRRLHGVSLMLAVIPARADQSLASRLADQAEIVVVQHGWAHLNHAPPGQPKAELGPGRVPAFVLGELTRGAWVLDRLFGDWLKVLVPPHNRITAEIARALPEAGYVGLSTDKARPFPGSEIPGRRGSGLIQVNTHIDIMEWTKTRAFLGEEPSLALAVQHLAGKREGRFDPAEPTGLLTHHLAHDEATWQFAERFLAQTRAHKAVTWRTPLDLFLRKIGAAP